MKRKVTTTTEEYDKDGNITSKITEITEEEDEGYIYPQHPFIPFGPFGPFGGYINNDKSENEKNCCCL